LAPRYFVYLIDGAREESSMTDIRWQPTFELLGSSITFFPTWHFVPQLVGQHQGNRMETQV
jgi:hypothetical protein